MKIMNVLITFALSFGLTTAFGAESKTCAEKAEAAAARAEAGGSRQRLMMISAGARLVSEQNGALVYKVEVFEQFSDGASTEEFPSVFYEVSATGDQAKCQLVGEPKLVTE